MIHESDVIIVGAGVVGLTLAALLARNQITVTMVESRPLNFKNNGRVSAIQKNSENIFRTLIIWNELKKCATPLFDMYIWDHTQQANLHFDSRDIYQNEMGWIIENNVITKLLYEKLKNDKYISIICPASPKNIGRENNQLMLTLDNQQKIKTDLLIGADGAHSWVREQMSADMKTRPYYQKAIIAEIQSDYPHENSAYQKFLTTGPVALLPLQNTHHTSLVWSADDAVSDELMRLSDENFASELEKALDFTLGRLKIVSARAQFPLVMRHTENYVTDNMALVGDAAHTIHPLAGLGVNLGLMDAASLTQVLLDARDKRKSLGNQRILRAYARWRRAENTPIIMAMRALKEIFALDSQTVNCIRSLGINMIDRCTPVKNQLMALAMGLSTETPGFLTSSQ